MTEESRGPEFIPEHRRVRLGDTPLLTVLVTSTQSSARLRSCLQALLPQCLQIAADIVVVRVGSPEEIAALQSEFANAKLRFIAAPATADEATLRMLGMAEAAGDIVFLRTDDAVPADWFPERLAARQRRSEAAPAS